MMAMSAKNQIILVNPNDKKIGLIEKLLGHRYGMLHRAFSVVIFRKRREQWQTLLQQRAKNKYHGGGLWTNACCSHPHPGEILVKAAEKRVKIEMGIRVKLQYVGKFHYIAQLDHGMTENEIDHVLVGWYEADHIPINHREVESYKWMNVDTLQKQLITQPHRYTPWLKQALALALTYRRLAKGKR